MRRRWRERCRSRRPTVSTVGGWPIPTCSRSRHPWWTIPSVSHDEAALTDHLEAELRALPHLDVERVGANLVARTQLGRSRRVVLAGHTDTVPVNGNAEPRLDGDVLWGLGSTDMKGGLAVMLALARDGGGPRGGRHLRLLRGRGGGRRAQRARPPAARPARAARGRRRHPGRAHRGRARGGLPGHAAHGGHPPGRAGPHRSAVDGPQRDPPAWASSSASSTGSRSASP